MKKIIKYIGIYIITALLCIITLVGTSKIPKSAIEKSMKESAQYYKKVDGIERIIYDKEHSFIHYYADSMLLNIIYCIDTNKPLESTLEARYYERIRRDVNNDFIKLVEANKEPNQQYMRYWHGSMVLIRPMLTMFNIEQIYFINTIVILWLIVILLKLLYQKHKALAIIFSFGLIMISIQYVTTCLEYTWTILLMLIASIIGIKIEKDKPNWLGPLFLITGMLTCFLDFLTTEILTLFIPLLFILIIRNKEGRLNCLKDAFIIIIKLSVLWIIGYVGMWLTKWGIAAIVLKVNVMDYVKNNAMGRIGINFKDYNSLIVIPGTTKLLDFTRLSVITKNIQELLPIDYFKENINTILTIFLAIFVLVEIVIVNRKNIKKIWFSLILLIIGIMPYIRYELLLNHSYRHRFFTFRNQLITIICLGMIIIDSYHNGARSWIKNLLSKKQNLKSK